MNVFGIRGPVKNAVTSCVNVSELGVEPTNRSGVPGEPTSGPPSTTGPDVMITAGVVAVALFTLTAPPAIVTGTLAVVRSWKLIDPVTVTFPFRNVRPG